MNPPIPRSVRLRQEAEAAQRRHQQRVAKQQRAIAHQAASAAAASQRSDAHTYARVFSHVVLTGEAEHGSAVKAL